LHNRHQFILWSYSHLEKQYRWHRLKLFDNLIFLGCLVAPVSTWGQKLIYPPFQRMTIPMARRDLVSAHKSAGLSSIQTGLSIAIANTD